MAAGHPGRGIVLLAILLLATLALAPLVGTTNISLSRAFDRTIPLDQNIDAVIFFNTRLPRILFAALVGAALACAGTVYQALLRNDLATPYTLGISGGASFGALLAMRWLAPLVAGAAYVLTPLAALAGAGSAMLLVTLLARRPTVSDRTQTLLLAGVTLNLLFASGILIVQYLSDPHQAFAMLRWMMGGLDVASVRLPAILAIPILGAFAVLMSQAQALNVMSIGDRTAIHLGLDADRVRLIGLGASSIMAALVVAWAGPIGFVGLVVPHLLRRFVGPDHRFLLPAVALGGASFLIICDTLARTIAGGLELPVGIITAAIGGPFFLWVLFRRG
ncbi:MAG TPA: iron ABC transporter permease [Candidatus Eisenbacteria bacterium]